MVAGHPVVGVERHQHVEASLRTVHHPDGDRLIERDHRAG
jgi:hypothetical protein